MSVIYVMCILTLLVSNVYPYKKVGMMVYCSNEGINELIGTIVNNEFRCFVESFKIPDIDGEYKLPIGLLEWHFRGITIAGLAPPTLHALADRDNSAVVRLQDFTFTIKGEYKLKLWTFSDSGSFEGTLCANGRSRGTLDDNNIMTWSECHLDVDCGFALNLKDNNFEIPDIVQNEINSKAKAIISSAFGNKLCDVLPSGDYAVRHWVYPINDIFAINVSIRKVLVMSKNADVTVGIAGSVIPGYVNETLVDMDFPFPAPDFKDTQLKTNKMVQVIMKNYTINTFVYTAVRLGSLNRNLLSKLLPPNQQTYLAVDCIGVCMGKLFPILTKRYPGGFININITFTDDIDSRVSDLGIYVYNTVIMDFYIGNDSLVTFSMDTETVAAPYVAKDTVVIRGRFIDLKVGNIHLISSNIGHVSFAALQWMSDIVKEVELVPGVKDIWQSGIDVSHFSQHRKHDGHQVYTYQDVDINLHIDTIIFSGNIVFRPKDNLD